jgi:Protein of unknown function (DUF3095)
MRSVISVPMTDGSSADRFLATVPSFGRFGQILDPQLYAALPDDWVVGLADVVSSTQASWQCSLPGVIRRYTHSGFTARDPQETFRAAIASGSYWPS